MAYIGIDLSISNTGIAVITDDGVIESKSIETKADNYITLESRIVYIVDVILDYIKYMDVNFIVIEDYAYGAGFAGSTNNITKLAELKGVVLHYIHKMHPNIQVMNVATTQMKKYVTGRGIIKDNPSLPKNKQAKYKKQVVIDSINRYYGTNLLDGFVESSDEADAIGLALICYHWASGKQLLNLTAEMNKAQAEVMKAVIKKRIEDIAGKDDKQRRIIKRKAKINKNL